MSRRAELTGVEKAVSETLDEVNFRMHGLMSSASYHQQFIDWLGEHGYTVVGVRSEPGYDRITEAIEDVLDSAAMTIEVAQDGHTVPLHSLARALDKAGLIDWSAFGDQP